MELASDAMFVTNWASDCFAGGLIYMVYGVRHSAEDPRNVKEQKKNESLKDLNRTSDGQDEQLIHETGQV